MFNEKNLTVEQRLEILKLANGSPNSGTTKAIEDRYKSFIDLVCPVQDSKQPEK